MAFNSDFIQASKLNASVSTQIAGHTLSNGVDDSLTLSGLSGVMTLTELNSSVVNADSLVVCPAINPSVGGVPILFGASLDIDDNSLLNVNAVSTTTNGVGTVGQVLKSDGTNSYWATDTVGDVSQWATYPATATVDLDGNILTNAGAIDGDSLDVTSVSTLSLNEPVNSVISVTADLDLNSTQTLKSVLSLTTATNVSGTDGQVLSADASGFLVWADAPADASTWSTFPATQDVDMDFNSLTDVQLLQAREGEVTGIQNFTYIDNLGTNIDVQCDLTIVDTKSLITSNIKSLTQATNDPVLVSSNLAIATPFLLQTDGIKSQTLATAIELQSNLTFGTGVGTISNIDVLSTINEGTGTDGQVLTSADGLTTWANPLTASNWSTYPATQNVDFAGFNLNDGGVINGDTVVAPIISSTGGNITAVNGTIRVQNGANTTVQFESGGVFQLIGSSGQILMYNTTDASALISASTGGNYFNSSNSGNMSGWGTISSQRLNPVLVNENSYYVSPHGIDAGNTVGSFEYPFQTIQYAIDITEALTTTDNEYRYIKVMPGSYSGNIGIAKKVYLQGQATTPFEASVGCQLTGTINIALDDATSSLFNNGVFLSGFLIGSAVNFASSEDGMLNIDNCYIYTADDASGRGVYFYPSATNGRLRITNTQIVSGGTSGLDPLIELTNSGSLIMNNCIVNAKGVQNCLKFSDTATCDTVNYVKFESDTTSASAPAIVEIASTNSASHAFANCGFIYSSATSKTANANASGILCNSASGNPSVVSTYNTFILAGTSSANYAIQDLQALTANAMICLFFMNGATPTNAFAINAVNLTNKFQLTVVS